MDALRHERIHEEPCGQRLITQFLGAGQRRILQAGKGSVDVLLECATLRLSFLVRQVGDAEVLDLLTEGGCGLDEIATRLAELRKSREAPIAGFRS